VNPQPEDLKNASATLFYAACPTEPLMALLDCSRGLNSRTRSFIPPSATIAEMLEAAEEAIEDEFTQQSEIILRMREHQARSLSEMVSGSFGTEPASENAMNVRLRWSMPR
jgi:hypothetical protein